MADKDELRKTSGVDRETQSASELSIQANNFGGLNTSANPLNLPYEDSPYLLNVVTDVSGALEKRKGTRVVYRNVVATTNVTLMPVSTALGYNLLTLKRGVDLLVAELYDNNLTVLMTKPNVWSSSASSIRASWTLTSEPDPRLLIMTGTNKPVQVQFIERQAAGAGSTTVVFENAETVRTSSASNTIIWVNRQRYTGSVSYSYNAGTKQLTLTTGTSIASGAVVDLTFVCWQWWAEARHWYGDRIFGTETRFNAVAADQVVRVPQKLTVDLDPKDNVTRSWSIYVWQQTSRTGGTPFYTRVPAGNPSAASEYWFSDGKRYEPGSFATTNASPYFITFGAINTGSPPPINAVYFTRDRALGFRSGRGQSTSFVAVYVDGALATRYTSVPGSLEHHYGLKDSLKALLTGSGTAFYVEFMAEAKIGVRPLSYVEFINTENTHIGSGSSTNRYSPTTPEGSYVPIYGLGDFADYFAGFYPGVVSAYQNRIVLSGFDHRPMLVLFSNIADSVTPNVRYNFFQITDDELSLRDSAPFDVELQKKGSDDRVVATVEWQRSLFVLTRRGTYRISGSVERVLKYDTKFVTFLSSTGCINSNCVVQTESSILYLSDFGLFDLNPRIEDGEFKVSEKSLKVRSFFSKTLDPRFEELAWLGYDSDEKYVYVGYPDGSNTWTSVKLYVYDVSRESWSEFTSQGYFRSFDAKQFIDRLRGQVFLMACTTEQNESGGSTQGRPENLVVLKMSDDEHFVDYYEIRSRSGSGEQYPTLQIPDIQFTTTSSWEQNFKHAYSSIGQFRGYVPLPFTDIEDVVCRVTPPSAAARDLVFLTEWFKQQQESFYISAVLSAGTVVSFRWKPNNDLVNPQGFSHLAVWVNRVVYNNYTLLGSGAVNDKYFTLPTSVPNNAIVEWGAVYPAVYMSPMFLNDKLGNYKRLKHANLFFDNDTKSEVYMGYNVNVTQSPAQNPEELVGRYKTRVDASISVVYNSNLDGSSSSDVYGFADLYFDESVFDYDPSIEQGHRYAVFKEAIQGVGYSYQLAVWSADEAYWKLSGYQIDQKLKGKRYTSRF